ncbi:MAG: c-type cytochrome, partial [Opitutaceae bacterium]
RSEAPAKLRAEALTLLTLWSKPPARARLVGIYRPLAEKNRPTTAVIAALEPHLARLLTGASPESVKSATITALVKLKLASASASLLALVANSAEPLDVRVSALRALHQLKAVQLSSAIEVALLAQEPELRLAALPLSIQLAPKTAIAVLVKLLANGTVLEKRAAFKALGTAPQPEANDVLLLQLDRLAAGQIEPSAQLELLEAATLRPDSRVKQALLARAALLAQDPDPLAAFRVALEGGDARAGRALFNNHPVMQCSRCHRDSDEPGGEAGPNLAGIGGRESREYLLQSILKPSAKFAVGFEIATITKKNGAVLVGTIIERTEKIVRLRTSATDPVEIAQADIQSLVAAPSAMPEIAALVMTKAEIRDLVAAVAGLRTTARRNELTPLRALLAPPID